MFVKGRVLIGKAYAFYDDMIHGSIFTMIPNEYHMANFYI